MRGGRCGARVHPGTGVAPVAATDRPRRRAAPSGPGAVPGHHGGRRQAEAFFFLTPPGTRGRPVHRDDADVLAVQIRGSKRWRVYPGPPDGNWRPERVDGDPGDPLLDVVLRQGEVLHVPRGFAHAAEATGGSASAHLSFTVREAGSAHLYAVLEALLLDGDGLPARPNDDTALTGAANDLIAHFHRTLAGLTPEELLHLARGAMRREKHTTAGAPSALPVRPGGDGGAVRGSG
ncbi:hypothetical protein GCM10010433_26120 [Streptomyces pulveraceus]|uniref:JmjC domain-containing protein n=1 Tax=Streptomyces pulveraceus TaxID=68258 RepID=A0ABW1GGL3_9ACTN